MELRQLRYAVAVARRRNFTRAAQDAAIAQPALSQQIAQLERELGVRLFERTNRSVTITDAGTAFLARADVILRDVEHLAEEMHAHAGGSRGRIVIGTYQSISEHLLPALLGKFHAKYPGIELSLREGLAANLLAGVVAHDIDVFIGEAAETYRALTAQLVTVPLFSDELGIAVGRHHQIAAHSRVTMESLTNEAWISFGSGSSLRDRLERLCAGAGFQPRIAIETIDSLTMRALVAEGLGIALFPRTLAQAPGPRISFLSMSPRPVLRPMSLVHRPHAGPGVARFIELITKALRRTGA